MSSWVWSSDIPLNIMGAHVQTTLSNLVSSVQFSSVTQLCPTLCDPMGCSTPGLPVHHQLPKFMSWRNMSFCP